ATTRALASERRALSSSVRGLDGVLGEAGPTLASINETIPPARAFTREARPGLRAAPETLKLANPVLLEVQKLLGRHELPALLDQLEPAQRTLASLAPRLVQLFDQVTPVTECLRTNAVPTLKKPVEDPPHSSGEPVYRELLYGLTGLASASQNFDGNGPAVRYHAGAGDQVVTFGQAPSFTEPVVGLTSEPLLGSRPRYTANLPPFRPDVPCGTQQPPDLTADTGPAAAGQQTTSATAAKKTLRLRALPDLLERAGKRAGTANGSAKTSIGER
nr:hypothetical protein [Thermoleophilaceae bacterium]